MNDSKDKVLRPASEGGDARLEPAVAVAGTGASTPEPSRDPGARTSFLGSLEGWLNFATAALVLVAAIGLPALAIQLVRFGVPVGTASYHDVLRAGALPAVVMAIVASYCVAAGRALSGMGWRRFFGLHSVLLLPLLIPVYLALLVGLLAYLLLLMWLVLWAIRFGVRFVGLGLGVTNRDLLFVAAVLVVISALIWWIARHYASRWMGREGLFWIALRRVYKPLWRQPQAQESLTDRAGKDESKPTREAPLWVFFSLPPMFLLMLYCIKWLLSIWDDRVGSAISHRYVMLTALAGGIVLALFFAGILVSVSESSERKVGPRGKRLVILVAAVAYVLFEAFYSIWGYPRLYAGLGGGRPQPATIWLRADDDAMDIVSVLRGTVRTRIGTVSRVDSVYILLANDSDVLLTDALVPPAKAVLVSRRRLYALSW